MSKPPTREQSAAEPSADPVRSFIEHLQNTPFGDHVVFGMVKPAETTDGLMVAHVGDCGSWVYLPASTIKAVRAGADVRCGGHTHATAAIQLHAPESDLEKAFAGVAGLHMTRIVQLKHTLGFADRCNPPCPPGSHCVTDNTGASTCQPGP